jgi:indolepyruvate ferredoxin oxidoreductase
MAQGEAFVRAVALNLSKLMAYKDEYEVARLYSDKAYLAGLDATLTGRGRMRIYLSPPLLSPRDPHTGLPKKRAFGAWVFPLFRLLQHGKHLRGTPLDVMGATQERAIERQLRDQYLADIDLWLDALSPHSLKLVTELANLPDEVRGFGHVKAASVATMTAKRTALMSSLARLSGATSG